MIKINFHTVTWSFRSSFDFMGFFCSVLPQCYSSHWLCGQSGRQIFKLCMNVWKFAGHFTCCTALDHKNQLNSLSGNSYYVKNVISALILQQYYYKRLFHFHQTNKILIIIFFCSPFFDVPLWQLQYNLYSICPDFQASNGRHWRENGRRRRNRL